MKTLDEARKEQADMRARHQKLRESLLNPSNYPPVQVERYDCAFARRLLMASHARHIRTAFVSPVTMRVQTISANVPDFDLVYLVSDEVVSHPGSAPVVKQAWERFPSLISPRVSLKAPPEEKWFDLAHLHPQRFQEQRAFWDFETLRPGGTIALNLWYTGRAYKRRKKMRLVIVASGPAVRTQEGDVK